MNRNIQVCRSCDNRFSGRYCSHCGEKAFSREEHTIRHFAGRVLNAFTFADNKLWKTLKYLFTRPGVLPRRFVDGQRRPFIAPLPLFLLINILYFLLTPVDTFNSFYRSQMNGQPYSSAIKSYGNERMEASGMEAAAFEEKYNGVSSDISKSILLLFPFLFAFPLWALFFRKSGYLFDHLMLAISFMSFVLLGILLILPAIIVALLSLVNWVDAPVQFDWNGPVVTAVLAMTLGTYLSVSLKNFYRENWGWAILKAGLLLVAFVFLMFLYRFILFFLTLWAM